MTCLGSAVYVFALVPLFAAKTNSTPTFVNVSTTLDSQPVGTFQHVGSPSIEPTTNNTSYQRSVPIFVKTGLADGPHTLTLNVGPDSVLLLDYIVYSQEDVFGATGSTAGQKAGQHGSSAIPTSPSSSSSAPAVPETPSAVLSQYV